MSRATKWKIEKAKVKVVFRLQFHATHIPQSGWEKLFISFIPIETGKATAKTSKANVRNGTCKWADPIYETTRLLFDSKTKQYDDKLYKLVVGMGTSRSSILGEATINLADYADASQPSAIALPLHGTDHGTNLHVTVQLLTAKTGFREFEQQRDKGLQSGNNVNKDTEPSTAKSSSSELQIPDDLVNKAKTRMQLREETSTHEEYSDSQVTCDGSSNTSEHYYAEKHDSPSEKLDGSDHAKLAPRSGSDYSMDNDVANVHEENHRLKGSLELAESSISELKRELTGLQNHANEMAIETQKFAQELAIEIASGQELAKEVTFLKSECSKFNNDLEKLKEMKSSSMFEDRKLDETEHDKQVKRVDLVESQIRKLQEKIFIGFRESDLSFLQSDLEVLLGTVQDLKTETVDTGEIPIQPLQELDIAKAERENLVKKMDQMECYYEGLVQELEENQKRILAELQNLKNEHSTCGYTINDLTCVNNELQKRVTVSESALKRARLNYSIAVSQLQKDLDMLSFQVLSMFETNQTAIKEAFSENSPPLSKHVSKGDVLSDDLKKSLSLQENIYKKVEEELGEMCFSNLHLDVYAGTLKETVFEASDHIRNMNKKLQDLAQKLQLSNQSRDVLFEDVHNLKGQNAYFLAKCNDLQLQNQMLEADLGNLSNENFLLMEKITECEALLMDYRVYKNKHEVVSAEKLELQNLLQVQVSNNQNLQKELENLRLGIRELTLLKETIEKESDDVKMEFNNSLHEMVTKLEIPYASLEKIQLQLDLVAKKFKSSLESGERHVQNSEVLLTHLSSLELELQKISSQDKNFHEQIMGLDIMAEEFEKSKLIISELKYKDEELDKLTESLEVERGLNNKLESMVAFLTSELESQRLELESQRSRVAQLLVQHEENLEKRHKDCSVDDSLVCQLAEMHEIVICEDLKLTFVKTQYETWIEELVTKIQFSNEQCGVLEKKHLDDKARLNSFLETEARYIKENEHLLKTLESFQIKLHDAEARLNHCLEVEARYVEENRNLASEVESLRIKIEALTVHNSEISEANNKHALKIGQLKDMLSKSMSEVEQYKEFEIKFHDTESKMNHCLENEARYIEENRNLATELESLRLKLEVSIAHNSEISEANNKHTLEVSQLKDMLTKSTSEIEQYKETKMNFQDTESKLSHCLANEAHYIEENRNLAKELESVRLKLEASIARESETSEANNKCALEISQLKDMLTKSKAEVEQYKVLQAELVDTESRLNYCLENEARLATEVESLRSELQASIAQNAEISDMLTNSKRDVGRCKELEIKLHDTESKLKCCLENEACYVKENENLAAELDSLRLKLEASIAQNAEISDMLTKSKTEIEQYRELQIKLHDTESRLNCCLENEARCMEENMNIASELESLRLKLEASIAQNAEISESKSKQALEGDHGLISREETEILLVVLKAKLDEQNDELIILQNKCNELTNKLSEQILKTEEFKNLSIYLKELKDNGDAVREKKEKEPEGPSESLRMAFIKEQYQTKLQELKQQLSVSKRHNEEMLFKLQDALDEIESMKKTEAFQLKRIQELEAEVDSVNSIKPDYDRIQAELECAVLSLECCKEEKEKVAALLQECEHEKSIIADELSLIKEQIAQKEENIYTGGNASITPVTVQATQGVSERGYEEEDNSLLNDSKQLTVFNDQFRAQHLRSCMEQLDEELEKMKNDNSLLPLTNYDPGFQDLQRELAQLNQANEELGSIYPNFVDFPGNGNALQRVLALEIELAEALRTKKKSSIQFQSSFLKQHSDEEAVFKSFRDINELIKDMLEIKGKYVNVENELKDMHDRYSQLSLQFAEVEGERQKLMMTLKNVRSSRNLLRLNRSSVAALGDQSL